MASIKIRISDKARTKPKASKATRTSGGTKPGARPVGKTTKLGIQGAWAYIFRENAKRKLSDVEIAKWMHKEFPGRGSKVFDAVSAVRSKYNAGGLTGGEAPKVRAVQYDDAGNPRKPQVAVSGKKPASAAKRKTKRAA